jgi:hypothetical protein
MKAYDKGEAISVQACRPGFVRPGEEPLASALLSCEHVRFVEERYRFRPGPVGPQA